MHISAPKVRFGPVRGPIFPNRELDFRFGSSSSANPNRFLGPVRVLFEFKPGLFAEKGNFGIGSSILEADEPSVRFFSAKSRT